MLYAALDAAITTVPRQLMADRIALLEMANTALWIVAGDSMMIGLFTPITAMEMARSFIGHDKTRGCGFRKMHEDR